MSETYRLIRRRSGKEIELGRFDSVEAAAAYLYNTESDHDERIAESWEAGDYDGCFRGDFWLRLA